MKHVGQQLNIPALYNELYILGLAEMTRINTNRRKKYLKNRTWHTLRFATFHTSIHFILTHNNSYLQQSSLSPNQGHSYGHKDAFSICQPLHEAPEGKVSKKPHSIPNTYRSPYLYVHNTSNRPKHIKKFSVTYSQALK